MTKLSNLSTAEKIELAEELWESVLEDQNNVPITDEQREELNKRLAQYEIDKDEGDTWELVRARISHK
jgi:putative addiction module component (TIGR02574 family)